MQTPRLCEILLAEIWEDLLRVIESYPFHVKIHLSLILCDQGSLSVYSSFWSPSQLVKYNELAIRLGGWRWSDQFPILDMVPILGSYLELGSCEGGVTWHFLTNLGR